MEPAERESRKRRWEDLRRHLRCIDEKIAELWFQERQIIRAELHCASPGPTVPAFSEDPTSGSDGEERRSPPPDKTDSRAAEKQATVFTVAKTGHVVTLERTRFSAEERMRLNRMCLELMAAPKPAKKKKK